MFSKHFILGAAVLAAATSAAPLVQRDGCEEGTFNCTDGTHYSQCVSGGTWSATMSVAPGTTCNVGISNNPFLPGSGSGTEPSPPPSEPSEPASEPSSSSDPPPKNGSPPAAATTTASAPKTTPTTTSTTSTSDGSCGGFTCIANWPSWEDMKAKYVNVMGTSCEASGWGANNSPDETQQVLSAIESGSGSVDPRFVLAIVIQESSGCVRVITTNNGVRNPGLMQDSNGAHTCNDAGSVQNPCPADEITGMIADGVSGGTDNLSAALATAEGAPNNYQDAFAYAVAARIYNSGSFDAGDLGNGLGSTSSYVSSVMSRVAGLSL